VVPACLLRALPGKFQISRKLEGKKFRGLYTYACIRVYVAHTNVDLFTAATLGVPKLQMVYNPGTQQSADAVHR